jgi:hypothetical protein
MLARRLAAAAAASLLLASAGAGADLGGSLEDDLRGSWTVEPQTRDYVAVRGNVSNQRRMSARNLGIVVEGLDRSGNVIHTRDATAGPRDISALGGVPFFATIPVGAPNYRARIIRVDWDQPTGQ